MKSSFTTADEEEPLLPQEEPPLPPFLSLPEDIAWNILARLPKSSYPTLSCVHRSLGNLVRSPELHKTRCLLGKDSVFLCFIDKTDPKHPRKWFSSQRENGLVSVGLLNHYHREPVSTVIAIGREIFIITGSGESALWIFDSQTNKIRRGPSLCLYQPDRSVGLVGTKLYAIGGYNKIQARALDLKKESNPTWETAPIPTEQRKFMWSSTTTASLNRKVYSLQICDNMATSYDPKDGSCESFNMHGDKWWRTGVCVIQNVLYVYYKGLGLMWHDFEQMRWRCVRGLDPVNGVEYVGLAECYGKLAFLTLVSNSGEGKKEVWFSMITLKRNEVGIYGNASPAQLVGNVPCGYKWEHCLSVSA